MRWTRQRRARKGLQGGFNSVSDRPARGRTALPTVFDETGRIARGPARALARRARTAKSCGSDAPTLASSLVEMCRAQPGFGYIVNPRGDGGKKARSPGRSRISRNPLRGESRDDPVEPVVHSCACCAHDRGCDRRPAFPAPSSSMEGETAASLGRIAPRGRTCFRDSINVIATRWLAMTVDGLNRRRLPAAVRTDARCPASRSRQRQNATDGGRRRRSGRYAGSAPAPAWRPSRPGRTPR